MIDGEGDEHLNAPESSVACREAIMDWSQLSQLADFAQLRHGYCNSNGGFGVTYPGDLDEYDVHVDGIQIPLGKVLVFGLAIAAPPGWELLVDESDYLHVLAEVLKERGLTTEAERVTALLNAHGES